jgi:arylsulfatase
MRIPFLFLIPLLLPAMAEDRPNVVLFIADDVSAADFGCYGHPTISTPRIDELAAGGLRFENAYLTTSSCSPTRTSLITGRYPHNTGAPELHMGDSPHLAGLPQFPALLREAGYHTALAGKSHFNGDVGKSFVSTYGGGASGAGKWIAALRDRPRGGPFFMWFAAYDAHRTWDQPLEEGPHGPDDVRVPPYQIDGPATREDLARYYNEVHRFDGNVGRVVDELKQQGVYENTVIIVIADNGRPFPRDKTWLYDSGIKTPLVIHWVAGLDKPAVVRSLVSVIDLPPTILKLAGVGVPAAFQGESLMPVLRNPSAGVRDFVFAERNWHVQRYHDRMVRCGDLVYLRNNLPDLIGFNYVHATLPHPAFHELIEAWRAGKASGLQAAVFATPRPREELFDVSQDPLQMANLVDSPEHAGHLRQLRRALDAWSEETGDTLPEVDRMTPDRNDRVTWQPLGKLSGHPPGGEVPGEATKAWSILRPGPVRRGDSGICR